MLRYPNWNLLYVSWSMCRSIQFQHKARHFPQPLNIPHSGQSLFLSRVYEDDAIYFVSSSKAKTLFVLVQSPVIPKILRNHSWKPVAFTKPAELSIAVRDNHLTSTVRWYTSRAGGLAQVEFSSCFTESVEIYACIHLLRFQHRRLSERLGASKLSWSSLIFTLSSPIPAGRRHHYLLCTESYCIEFMLYLLSLYNQCHRWFIVDGLPITKIGVSASVSPEVEDRWAALDMFVPLPLSFRLNA